MFTDTRIADLNGPLLYCGPARFGVRPSAAPAATPIARREADFGDLRGPIAYWGPATAQMSGQRVHAA